MMAEGLSRKLLALALGGALGFSLSRIGFTSYDAVHGMFTFADLRMFFVFMGGVGLTMLGLRLVPAARAIAPRAIDRATIIGGVIFGLGWAISGACPGAAIAMLGEGHLGAGASLVGIVVGMQLHATVNDRWLHWGNEACG